MAPDKPLIVVGHQNPDTDSICSAIGYARYKSQVQDVPARACRAGNINEQTRFALQRFGAPAPDLLTDVHPRISDIMIGSDVLYILRPEQPLAEAKEIILKNRFSFLPVADAQGTCLGKITTLRLASLLDDLGTLSDREHVRVDLRCLAKLSGARPTGLPTAPAQGRFVFDATTAGLKASELRNAIVLCRYGELETVLTRKPQVAVVCTEERLTKDHRRIGAENNVHLLPVPVGLPRAAVNLCLSMPVEAFIEPAGPTFEATATVRDVEREVNKYNEGGFIITDDADRIVGVVTRVSFMSDPRFSVALVDHNEFSQAVVGIEHAKVVEIIDHHRIGTQSTTEPITFINRVVGSTCSIVADLFRQSRRTIGKETAGLLISGLLSDTVILKSPTTTEFDRKMATWLAQRADVEIEQFGRDLFAAGSAIESLSAAQIVGQDQKGYSESGYSFSVSQIEMIGFTAFWERSDELRQGVAALGAKHDLDFACLMVTDITGNSTLLVVAGSQEIMNRIDYPLLSAGVYEMQGVLSRKKQVLPYLIELLRDL